MRVESELDRKARSCREEWDRRHACGGGPGAPDLVLHDHAHLLPTSGCALDLACGLGGNALWLAERGLEVSAWDLSPVAIERLRSSALSLGLTLDAVVRDVVADPPPAARFDLIVVTHFLERLLAPAIASALKPGGLLCYQTFVRESVSTRGPGNPAYRLAPNELLHLFPGLRLCVYRDEGRVGDLSLGLRDLALLIARREAGFGPD